MPQRFLRPGITNSERWNSVPHTAGSLYIRILTLVDDFGRYDGRPSVILGQCFAVWNELNPAESCNLQQVAEMLQQLASKRLIELYEVDGKTVLQVCQWHERVREGCKMKYPPAPKNGEVAASCSKAQQVAASLVHIPASIFPRPSPASIASASDHIPEATPLVELVENPPAEKPTEPQPETPEVENPDSKNFSRAKTKQLAIGILDYLNSKAGRQFRPTEENLTHIACRLEEVTLDTEGVKKMIDSMIELWKGDPKMERFLRPETLFGKQKFGSYYDDRNLPVTTAAQKTKGSDHAKGF